MSDHICVDCGMPVFAGQIIREQDRHAVCLDPDMKKHKTISRPCVSEFKGEKFGTFQIGYVNDDGKEVWL